MFSRLRNSLLARLLRSYNRGRRPDWNRLQILLRDVFGSDDRLKDYLEMDASLYELISLEGGRQAGGHPKIKYLNYSKWFIDRLNGSQVVVDLGCGTGHLSERIADETDARVVGVEIDSAKARAARESIRHERVSIIEGDITAVDVHDDLRRMNVDSIILSNVLEHIVEREKLLKSLRDLQPERLLIRVPQYDRDWRVPVKNDRGVYWKLDPTHVLEYTEDALDNELAQAGFTCVTKTFNWGEIWAEYRFDL